jgi:16S rRNA (cytosine967-C5)-methyltransferase
MKPAAQLQSAIDLLEEIIIAARDNGASADALATKFFAARRYAGSKDRRKVRDLTWAAIRAFGERPETARSAFVALADKDTELAALFDGTPYGPAIIDPDEERARGEVIPAWIKPLFSPLIDDAEQAALLERAPLDVRVNRLKGDRASVIADLPEAEILPQSGDALRLPTGFALENHSVITQGHADIQDLGSQLIVDACAAKPGMTVLDLCAGAGGKTLALASAMMGEGRLIGSDTNRNRLGQLIPRAQRAGASNIEALLLNPGQESAMLAEFASKCDVVLIDAPCSGSGTWRRNPETRWRLNPVRLQQVIDAQAKLLAIAAEMVASGGHLVYAVCSLLEDEGRGQVERFLDSHDGWRVCDADITAGRIQGCGLMLTPHHDGSDGFFLARLQKL